MRPSGLSNHLLHGMTNLRKTKRGWLSYRQLFEIRLISEKTRKEDKSLEAEQAVHLGSLRICTAVKDCSELL